MLAAADVRAQQARAETPTQSPAAATGRGGVAPPSVTSPAGKAEPKTVRRRHPADDPLENLNRALFAVHQFFDRILFRPAAIVYKTVVPKPLRRGITHLFSNISEPIVFVNDILQLRPKRAAETMSRFIINSTAGLGGIFDVAKTVDLPHRDNGLGNTLALYGVGPGPYLFIPFFGPGNFRDSLANQVDAIVVPIGVGFPFNRFPYTVPSTVFPGLDLRIESDEALKTILGGAADPYATLRSVYTQNRAADIAELTGKKNQSPLDDPLLDPEAPVAAGAAPESTTPDAASPADPAPPADIIDPLTTPPPVVKPIVGGEVPPQEIAGPGAPQIMLFQTI